MEIPHIDGSELDDDRDDSDPNKLLARVQTYIAAQDQLILAIQNDSGLSIAEVNKYLPTVLSALGNVASAFPGAAPIVGALLKVIPNQIP